MLSLMTLFTWYALSDFCKDGIFVYQYYLLMLVLQLFPCAIFNGYEALIVLTHSCSPVQTKLGRFFGIYCDGIGSFRIYQCMVGKQPWDTDRTYLHSLFEF